MCFIQLVIIKNVFLEHVKDVLSQTNLFRIVQNLLNDKSYFNSQYFDRLSNYLKTILDLTGGN